MQLDDPIFIAGATGLVGSTIAAKLKIHGYSNLITQRVGLMSWQMTYDFFKEHKPKYVFLCAAKVGGIGANSEFPAEFITNNLLIQTNAIHIASMFSVKKLLFLGSSCIYPKMCEQPIKEEYLMTGTLEPTNSAYAMAKLAGIEMIKAYRKQYGFCGISLMPTNLYGDGDNFNLNTSHVLPAMIRKFHDAKVRSEEITLWGDGTPRREFLHVDDLADAAIFLMNTYDSEEIINVGCGKDVRIHELADLVKEVVGYKGIIKWDISHPNGTPRKVLDISKLTGMGWKPKISLENGIRSTYYWYLKNLAGHFL